MDEQQAAGLEDAHQFGERPLLLLDRGEVVQHVDGVDEIVRTRRFRDAQHRSDADPARPADVPVGERDLARGRVDAVDLESQLTHAPDVPALTAARVEAPPRGRQHASDDVAHQLRFLHEQRGAPRFGNLHVVGVGDLVEVLRTRRRRGPHMDEQEHHAERRRHAHRRQPDAKHGNRRRCPAQARGLQLVEQPRAGDQHAAWREHQAAETRGRRVGVFRLHQ